MILFARLARQPSSSDAISQEVPVHGDRMDSRNFHFIYSHCDLCIYVFPKWERTSYGHKSRFSAQSDAQAKGGR